MGSRDWLKRFDYGLLLPLAGSLPFPLAEKMAELRGWIHYRSNPDSRNHASQNVSWLFPELNPVEVRRIVLKHYQTPARDEVEAFWFSDSLSHLRRFTGVRGLKVLKEAVAAGSGVLLFSGHIGSTGLFFSFVGKSGVPLNIVGRSIDPAENPLHPAEWAFNKKRVRWIEEAVGNPFLLTGMGNYSAMLKKLGSGEVVMLLIDVVPTLAKRHVPVLFFGRQARLADGIASLYKESNARLLTFVICWDHRSRKHSIEIRDLTESVPRDWSNQAIMQTLVGTVERYICDHPEQWWCWDSLAHYFQEE